MVARRLLVVDVDTSPGIADQLRTRGRNAISAHFVPLPGVLHVKELKDTELLPKLAAHYLGQDWILVTGDDQMPLDHHELCVELGLTIATIDGRTHLWKPDFETIDKWRYDVIHRYAHKMEEQEVHTFRRYGNADRIWTPRGRVMRGPRRKLHPRATTGKVSAAKQPPDTETLF